MLLSAEKPIQTPLHFVEEAFGPLGQPAVLVYRQ
jgi:hypothetical protein